MDIKGGKAYLTQSEQTRSQLESPIELNGLPIEELLTEAKVVVEQLEAVVHSGPQDYLPKEKDAARPALEREYGKRHIYVRIAIHMMLEGTVDVSSVIDKF